MKGDTRSLDYSSVGRSENEWLHCAISRIRMKVTLQLASWFLKALWRAHCEKGVTRWASELAFGGVVQAGKSIWA